MTAADAGFEVVQALTIQAPPEAVWAVLIAPARWWSPAHSWSGDAANLSLDPQPGGCFCERLPNGGVEHMRVIHAAPARLLRLSGALGPLQSEAVAGVLTVELAPAPGGATALRMRYVVGGFRPGGLRAIAAPVDGVLGEQAMRLKRAAERATR